MLIAPRYVAAAFALMGTLWYVSGPAPAEPGPGAAPSQRYRIVNTYPHDPDAYTQGLIVRNGFLYESTGRYGRSTLRKVELETGRVLQLHRLEDEHFGEGLAEWQGRLVQLTWDSETAFVHDLSTFAAAGRFAYPGEGWGLTHDGKDFVLSDGTETLRFLDSRTFRETRRLVVRDGDVPIEDLNELEFVRGEILANVWHSDRIARISPTSGRVIGWIDLAGILSPLYRRDPEAVLNGIAYDSASDRLFVTGKLWPRLFEIEIVPG